MLRPVLHTLARSTKRAANFCACAIGGLTASARTAQVVAEARAQVQKEDADADGQTTRKAAK